MSAAPAAPPVVCTTLVGVLRRRALEQPDRRAYIFLQDGESEELSLTYGALDRRARAIAARLGRLGTPGERALLLYPPGLELIAAFFGCLYAGMVAVPAYPPRPNRFDARPAAIATDAQPTLALTTKPLLARLRAQLESFPGLRWIASDDLDERAADAWHEPAVDDSSLALLQYTSGSTATPKGVMVTHGNLLHNSALIRRAFQHTPASVGVTWLPPYHDMGLVGGIIQPLCAGFPAVLMPPVAFLQRPVRWLRAISRYRATTSGAPNFAYDLCVRKIRPEQRATLDLRSWAVAVNGAEPVDHETLEQFARTFGPCGFRQEAFYPSYGLAEATLFVSGVRASGVRAADPSSNGHQLVSRRRTRPDQELVVVNPETGVRCPPGRIGEIWVAGPSVARGYWNRPEATERTFGAYLAEVGEGPFLRTGDLGMIDDGELLVAGRLKELIILDGRNHHPADIERTVERSVPTAGGCAAFSTIVDGRERLVVAVEVDPGRWLDRRPQGTGRSCAEDVGEPDELRARARTIRRAVSEHHDVRVHRVLLLRRGSIPRTSSGKIQRHVCRDRFAAGVLDQRLVLGQAL